MVASEGFILFRRYMTCSYNKETSMRKFLIIAAIALLPTAAAAQHRGGGHGGGHGGGFHGGGVHHGGGGHWHNGAWVPWAVGGAILGGAIIGNSCYRWVVDQWGYQRRVWVC